jgi:hypothetical protein
MKKIIATTLATLMFAAVSIGGAVAPAAAAPYHSMHPSHPMVMPHHPKHWHQHLVCKTVWHHHKKARVCTWVPDHH